MGRARVFELIIELDDDLDTDLDDANINKFAAVDMIYLRKSVVTMTSRITVVKIEVILQTQLYSICRGSLRRGP